MLPARLRTFFLIGGFASAAVLLASFCLENTLGLVPCSLCFSQRLLLGLYAWVCMCAVLHSPGMVGKRNYAVLALGCSLSGALLASRHVWLQGAGLTVDACQMPFAWMLEQSWEQALKMLVLGGPDCTSLTWSFVDLTLPEWSLLAFLSLSVLPLSWLLGYRMRQLGKG
ncbi:disulfide bond formation protein B [Pseudomonas guariconensis]|uniref:disulfide bond formation protein B n=1 Tax=Pseudomonas guariconensis TaxID=1288410 RepID=UPI002D1E6037|nr:disulfide bond formation protein B [Pseudomonas guariconensis]MEB3839479.1 disulfide bond formation protein B [Pseudomonas guariconensis]MEB3872347.1 disulfide bond formation protein B [Pseudomonas guariconensis]MEB3878004.1 disulfide bond formation protein B [Pseudomonas guariconensis]MEB3894351.1 disulfide bond formation protein B [Pseudomonas guariconensis]